MPLPSEENHLRYSDLGWVEHFDQLKDPMTDYYILAQQHITCYILSENNAINLVKISVIIAVSVIQSMFPCKNDEKV